MTETVEKAQLARRRLPDERHAITHKFTIAGHEGYVTVGLYNDGKPGEVFLLMAKEGTTISGLMDAFATAVSMALQYGVPLEALVEKFVHVRYEPSGFTRNPKIPYAKSVTDYIFRWLALKFIKDPERSKDTPDVPPCRNCGIKLERSGDAFKCPNCGTIYEG